MKNLLLSTAILAATAFTASAQDANSPFRTEADSTAIMASAFIGMRVYASEAAIDVNEVDALQEGWEDIGEINDVVLNRDGNVDAVMVDIGGFLGMGERQVAVSMEAIQFVSDAGTGDNDNDFFLVMNAGRATLEGAPEYTMSGMTDMDAADTMAQDDAAAADATATTDTEIAADTDAAEGEMATEAPAADATAAADADVTVRDPISRDGYDVVERDALTTDDLTGARVYDENDEWIGEVGELVVTEEGRITEAVVDVGGFLGMGEKPVALNIDEVDILRQADGNEVRVYVTMTKDELEGLPRYDG